MNNSEHHLFTNNMHFRNLYKHKMSFHNMFRYMCTIYRENIKPILQNQMLVRSCYLWVPWSVAASSLTVVICEGTAVLAVKRMGTLRLKMFLTVK
jgi:hypothetical protein